MKSLVLSITKWNMKHFIMLPNSLILGANSDDQTRKSDSKAIVDLYFVFPICTRKCRAALVDADKI